LLDKRKARKKKKTAKTAQTKEKKLKSARKAEIDGTALRDALAEKRGGVGEEGREASKEFQC